ncbi:hypothetical protein [Nocardia macrotermitis]|uniref:Type II secretion system protein GspF domain-containing protein n=1 Tax=Nocardia macrotermitis TaxID=2585198 RepID=A0A7K0CWT3_9NOCA|nr:hypothetical protein [Nocardia macrotermitis]MQY17955.1 hypothetical protein [Nocardia macrotermitis]
MSPLALVCLAVALFAVPHSAGTRRYRALFGVRGDARKVSSHRLFRVGAGLGVAAAAVAGIGAFLAALLLVATVGLRRRRARETRRHRAECVALLEGLETVIGELRVGTHPSAAAAVAAEEVEGIAARAFAIGSARSRLGGSAAAGLRTPDSVIAADLARIADAWQLADHHGLALAELLTAARSDLAGRIRFRDRTTAALAGARASAVLLSTLPLLGLALGHLMHAAPLHVLLTPGPGTLLLPLGTALICTGLLWADAITSQVPT